MSQDTVEVGCALNTAPPPSWDHLLLSVLSVSFFFVKCHCFNVTFIILLFRILGFRIKTDVSHSRLQTLFRVKITQEMSCDCPSRRVILTQFSLYVSTIWRKIGYAWWSCWFIKNREGSVYKFVSPAFNQFSIIIGIDWVENSTLLVILL